MAVTSSATPAEASSRRADCDAIRWLATLRPATQTRAVSKAKPSLSLTLLRVTAAIRKIAAGSNSQGRGVGLWARIAGVLGKIRNVAATRHVALITIEDNATTFFPGSRGQGSHLLTMHATSRSSPSRVWPIIQETGTRTCSEGFRK